MRICTVQFDGYSGDKYSRLLNVFRNSCRINSPGVFFDEIKLPDQSKDYNYTWNQQANTLKLKKWYEYMLEAKEVVVFADCDMIATGDISKIEDYDFDIAYAGDSTIQHKINGGIIFARPTEAARNFFKAWVEQNEIILNDPIEFRKYTPWAGQNQRAFGRMMTLGYPECKLLRLKPLVWNATDSYWSKINDETLLVHIKGQIRNLVLGNKKPYGIYEKAMNEWYKYSDLDIKELKALWKTEPRIPRIPNRWA